MPDGKQRLNKSKIDPFANNMIDVCSLTRHFDYFAKKQTRKENMHFS